MAAQNYVLLERIELLNSAASVTFNNIPQTGYTDLKIVCSSRTSRTSDTDSIKVRFNGSSSSYTNKVLYGSGSGAGSFAGSTDAIGNAYTASDYLAAGLFGSQEFYVPNYTGSAYKSVSVESVEEANTTYAEMDMIAGLWSNTAAITSITILPNVGGALAQYSTFSLYGLAALGTTPSIPKATGGDSVYSDGTYWYHIFTSTGSFQANQALTCNYLVVAGGGGGAGGPYNGGGGGGAGGLRSTVTATGGGGSLESALSVAAGTYAVTVGAGGAGGVGTASAYANGSQGSNSVFSTVTSIGGGYGIMYPVGGGVAAGGTGGSGGGGSSNGGTASNSSGTANQGYAGGGVSGPGPWAAGGGGGGAGAVGSGGTAANLSPNSIGGNGGNGVAVAITGSSVTYAGGGGGSTGYGTLGSAGSGGAGAAVRSSTAPSATANTGSGGGANGNQAYPAIGGNGGSGIVVIRYAV